MPPPPRLSPRALSDNIDLFVSCRHPYIQVRVLTCGQPATTQTTQHATLLDNFRKASPKLRLQKHTPRTPPALAPRIPPLCECKSVFANTSVDGTTTPLITSEAFIEDCLHIHYLWIYIISICTAHQVHFPYSWVDWRWGGALHAPHGYRTGMSQGSNACPQSVIRFFSPPHLWCNNQHVLSRSTSMSIRFRKL